LPGKVSHPSIFPDATVKAFVTRRTVLAPIALVSLVCTAACQAPGGLQAEGEPILFAGESASQESPATPVATVGKAALASGGVARPESPKEGSPGKVIEEVIVEARRERHEVLLDLVSDARSLLRDVELDYVFTGSGRREVLRGRPVVFALWSEAKQEWSLARIEIPRPPVSWKPGRKPFAFRLLTPGIEARHVRGTGAERLMFAFAKDGEQLKVYGRKFPVFDSALIAKKKWRAVVATATPIVYLPSNDDTFDPKLVSGGKDFLLGTAQKAIEELRLTTAPSVAYPGQLLAEVVPAEVLATLAVIEQTDDADFISKKTAAFAEVLNQYGLKREEAYRYSVSSAAALGPMQFTNRRGNGTYAMVVRRCPRARLDPNFERGATNLLNAMKAATCLFDVELSQMRADIRLAYRDNMEVLGVFPVAAYNGGPRNVAKLYGVMRKMGVRPEDLRPPGEQPAGRQVSCPCLWKQEASGVRPVPIPRYNNENRWYVEKYQSILRMFD
jgi:hypothetical protein